MAVVLHMTAEEGSRLWHGFAGQGGSVFFKKGAGRNPNPTLSRCRGPDFVSERYAIFQQLSLGRICEDFTWTLRRGVTHYRRKTCAYCEVLIALLERSRTKMSMSAHLTAWKLMITWSPCFGSA